MTAENVTADPRRTWLKEDATSVISKSCGSPRFGLAAVLLLAVLQSCAPSNPEPQLETETTDPLEVLGYRVTSGAAPGYVEDIACRTCHSDLWDSYQEVGMSRSFYRPRPAALIEDFDAGPFFHEPSGRYYEMRRRGDKVIFRRYQRTTDGKPIHAFETEVDWILGSGNHTRSYLYQSELGELFQLPINWYSQTHEWGMAPGFETGDHFGVHRRVEQECMFCHNAYPDVAEGSDRSTGMQTFPHDLPEGTGCQRCHGPGAAHVRTARSAEGETERIRAEIVNPGNLSPQRRNDVCYQCHLQPSVVLTSVRRFDRGVYSFRPGQSLADYKVALDPAMDGETRADRFEINHHPYRLEQSACFLESKGALNCMTCHDPHRRVPPEERAEHYRAACAGCHEFTAKAFRASHDPGLPQPAESDCTSCHMQERRTQDVVLVTMTDHYIRRKPGGPELVAPREKKVDPVFVGVDLVYPTRGPDGLEAGVYRAVGTLGAEATEVAVGFLEEAMPEAMPFEPTAWLHLAQGQLSLGRLPEAEQSLNRILSRNPDHGVAREALGVVQLIGQDLDAATMHLRRATELNPLRPEAHYNLALALIAASPEEALEPLGEAISLRPNYADAWFSRGQALQAIGQLDEAERHYRRALELEPGHGRGYLAIASVLDLLGRRDEALLYLQHGSTASSSADVAREALRLRVAR